jgi:hypothetical protein
MPKLLFYLCVVFLSLGQFSVLGKDSGISLYLFDIFVFCLASYGFISLLISKRKLNIPLSSVPFLLFTFWALVSNIVNFSSIQPDEALVSNFYFLRWFLYLICGIVVFNLHHEKLLNFKDIEKALIISALFLVFAGLVQLVLIPDFEEANLTAVGWDPHKNRLASTFFDPNFLGAYLNIAIFLLLSRNIDRKVLNMDISRKIKISMVNLCEMLVLLFLILGVALTFSRSAWLMLGIGVLIFGVIKRPIWVFASVLIAFLAYFAVPRVQTRISGITDPADSAQFRLISWGNAKDIFLDNKMWGVGFNSFRYAQKDYGYLTPDTFTGHSGAGADSSLLFVFSTTGVLGGVLFVWGGYTCVKNNGSLFYTALIISLLIESVFINSLFYPQILFWITCLGFIPRASRTLL